MVLNLPTGLDAAEREWLAGNDANAEALLLEACEVTHTCSAIVELGFARYAAHMHESVIAAELAESVVAAPQIDNQLRAWAQFVCAVVGARVPPAFATIRRELAAERPPAGDRIAAWGAAAAVELEMWGEARAWIELATQEPMSSPARLMTLQASAAVAIAEQRTASASQALQDAIELARNEGWKLAQARLELMFGTKVASAVDASPVGWISRAAGPLMQVGSWRDRSMLRAALRAHGRRLADRALDEAAERPLARLGQATGSLRLITLLASRNAARSHLDSTLAHDTEKQAFRHVLDHIRGLSADVAAAELDMGELVSEALVERDRTAVMVQTLADLERVKEPDEFAATGASIAAQILGASRVWLVERVADRPLRVLGAHPPGAMSPDESWVRRIDEASDTRSDDPVRLPRRRPSLGSTLAVSVEALPFRGALLLDKGDPQRRFREDDRVLATLLGGQLAHGLARMRSGAAEKVAHTRLEATIESIRDGVLALDADGRVRSANAAAMRMLRMGDTPLVGSRLIDLAHVQPLWQVLSTAPRADSTVVCLAHGTIVVTSRPVAGKDQGVVATLVELGRAELMARQITAARPRYTFDDIVGISEAMVEVRRLARLAAEVEATLLITGESGTGKEMFAQAVHTGGVRAQFPFVGINCAALPRDLLEAELFGYERGAFTGAKQLGQAGKFEQVGAGTLLLDEIGDMPLDMQAKLLRVLQERSVVRLGGTQERLVQARIISTTNRNLEDAVARSTFRLDLLFRLRVLHIHIPPLRSRPEDIAVLAQHFLLRTARVSRKSVRQIGADAMRKLEQHDWPGNVREIANVIEREVTMLPSDATSLDVLRGPLSGDWPVEEPPSVRTWATTLPSRQEGLPDVRVSESSRGSAAAKIMADVERETYLEALDVFGGNVLAAAKSLGVSKSRFYTKLKRWREQGLVPPSQRGR